MASAEFEPLAFLSRQRWSFLLQCITGTASIAALMATPIVVGAAIDALEAEDNPRFYAVLGLLLAVCVLGIACTVYRQWLGERGEITATTQIARAVGDRITEQRSELRGSDASIPLVVGSDAEDLGGIVDTVAKLIGSLACYVAVTIWLLYSVQLIGLVVAAGVPLMMLASSVLLKPIQSRTQARRERVGDLSPIVVDIARGLRVLSGLRRGGFMKDRYQAASKEVLAAERKLMPFEVLLVVLGSLLPLFLSVLLVGLSAREALAGRISPGDVVAVYGLSLVLGMPVATLISSYRALAESRVAAGRVQKLLDSVHAHQDDDDAPSASAAEFPSLAVVTQGVRTQDRGLITLHADTPEQAETFGKQLVRNLDSEAGAVSVAPGQVLYSGPLRFRQEMKDSTLLMATHHADTALAADRVLVLEYGRVVEDGQPADLLQQEGPFAQWHAAIAGR